jgi:hypothetical protein
VNPTLYMHTWMRERYLSRHRFSVEQINKRVLLQYSNIEAEADEFARAEYERMGQHYPESDDGSAAEEAWQRGIEFHGLLSAMREEMRLAALAAIFQQWDKDLRSFLEHELVHDHPLAKAEELAWDQDGGSPIFILKAYGWDCGVEAFFEPLKVCRLIVNVYKHGKGRALNSIGRKYPQYLRPNHGRPRVYLDYSDLIVTPEQYAAFVEAIERFWQCFPERLYLTST